jgi:hypothetical protein
MKEVLAFKPSEGYIPSFNSHKHNHLYRVVVK